MPPLRKSTTPSSAVVTSHLACRQHFVAQAWHTILSGSAQIFSNAKHHGRIRSLSPFSCASTSMWTISMTYGCSTRKPATPRRSVISAPVGLPRSSIQFCQISVICQAPFSTAITTLLTKYSSGLSFRAPSSWG